MNETVVIYTPHPPCETSTLPRARVTANAELVAFDKAWHGTVLRAELDVALRIVPLGEELGIQFTGGMGEVSKTWLFDVAGDTTRQFDLVFGLPLIVSIFNWSAAAGQIRFDLSVEVLPPFSSLCELVAESITVRLPSVGEIDRLGVQRWLVDQTRRPGGRAE